VAKILYVDADAGRRDAVCRLLRERGHAVTAVASAERAMLQVEHEHDYDVVVLDLVLKGIDGAELCRWLAHWSRLPAVPRLVFSTPEMSANLRWLIAHAVMGLKRELPRWLPADVYIHMRDAGEELVQAIEGLLARGHLPG
jgi:CheY-like chemotaxis protein